MGPGTAIFRRQSRSSAGGIIAVLIALVIGGGAGYGGARFLTASSDAELTVANARINELEQANDSLRIELQETGTQTHRWPVPRSWR